MDYSGNKLTPAILSRFQQLKNLQPMQLELLAGSLRIRSVAQGTMLLARGDSDAYGLYLLKGKLRLTSLDGRVTDIGDDSPQALSPIAHLLPRQYDVSALTRVEYLTIDNQLLQGILSDQGDAFTATEIIAEEDTRGNISTEDQLTQTLLDDLEHDRLVLPSLPDIAIRVGREMNEENTNAHKLAHIIQTDPVITTKLIRAANSPLYAGVSPVDSCSTAVIRLGANTTHNLVLTFALRELFVTRSPTLKTHMKQLWEHSVKVSAICYVLAKVVGGFNPEHALLAGLLHDIGVVAILNYTKRYPDVLKDETILNQVISDLRGVIGGRILRTWSFLEDLATAAEAAEDWQREHDGPVDYADLVLIAQLHSFIGTPKMRDYPTLDSLPALHKLDIGELTPKLSLKILDKAVEKIHRAEALLKS